MADIQTIRDRLRPGWKPDPDSALPAAVQRRCHALGRAARCCYRHRDDAKDASRLLEADDFEVIGDLYLGRVKALVDEWEVLTSDNPGTLYPPRWL